MPHILYVDDDLNCREIVELVVNEMMTATTLSVMDDSANFQTRLEQLDPKPDVILLDINVEPLDGFAMLELLRASDSFRATPILALTASVMNEEVHRLKQAGFNGAFSKPLDIDQFPILIDQVLQGETVWNIAD